MRFFYQYRSWVVSATFAAIFTHLIPLHVFASGIAGDVLYPAHHAGCTKAKRCSEECWGINLSGGTGYQWEITAANAKRVDLYIRVASPADKRQMALSVNSEQVGVLTTDHTAGPRPIGKELGPFPVRLTAGLNVVEISEHKGSPRLDIHYLRVKSSVRALTSNASKLSSFNHPVTCPKIPGNQSLDDKRCIIAADLDQDGIFDHADLCPNTEANASVNKLGCSTDIQADTTIFGDQKIQSVTDNVCLSVVNDGKNSGDQIRADECDGSDSNLWQFDSIGKNIFTLLNRNASRLMDVSKSENKTLELGATHVRCNTNYWQAEKQQDETYLFKSLDDLSLCLEVKKNSISKDSADNVHLRKCHDKQSQRFKLSTARPADTPCWAGSSPGVEMDRLPYWPELEFSEPVDIVQEPVESGSHFYIVEKGGRVLRLADDPNSDESDVFFQLENVWNQGEAGMASLVFDPDYGVKNRYIYVTYVSNSPRMLRLSRFKASKNRTKVDVASEHRLFEFPITSQYHNSGALTFGPGPKKGVNYLYFSMGDDGCLCKDDFNLLKLPKMNYPHGKILRLSPKEFRSKKALSWNWDEGATNHYIVASGLRNPWRMSFIKDELWISNVGSHVKEEINRFNVIDQVGTNFGWPWCEGATCCEGGAQCNFPGLGPKPNNLTPPVLEYFRKDGPNEASSVIAGFVYEGNLLPQLKGKFIWADYSDEEIYALNTLAPKREAILSNAGNVSDFGLRHDGEIMFVDHTGGKAYMIVPGKKDSVTQWPPKKLKNLGCFTSLSNGDPIPASNVHAFDVAQSFWSDGAHKTRYLALPKGSTIDVSDPNNYVLPPGGVTLKNFYWGDEIFETRLFVRHTGGEYAGYTYKWTSPNSAELVPKNGGSKQLAGLNWEYPSRAQCLICHNSAVGKNIALEARQLNVNNQLHDLTELGLFNTVPESRPAFPKLEDENVPLNERALAYLHVNCANCHRGEDSDAGRSQWDARITTAFKDKLACNQDPIDKFSKDPKEKIINPGAHQLSAIWMRAHQRDVKYMPPLGSQVPDEKGMALIAEWIDQMNSCH